MPDDRLICKHCGKPADMYATVEATGVGWSNVWLELADDDSVVVILDPAVQEVEWQHHSLHHVIEYGCSECGALGADPLDIVELEIGDQLRWLQRHPPPGQLRIEL